MNRYAFIPREIIFFALLLCFSGLLEAAPEYLPISTQPFAELNTKDGDGGWMADYFAGSDFPGEPVTSRIEKSIGSAQELPPAVAGKTFSVRWTATITPKQSGQFIFRLRTKCSVVMKLDGETLLESSTGEGANPKSTVKVEMESAKPYELVVELPKSEGKVDVSVEWTKPQESKVTKEPVETYVESVVGPETGSRIGEAMEWKNEIYSLQSKTDGTMVLTEKKTGASAIFNPQLMVVWQNRGSETKMDPKGVKCKDDGSVGSINYVAPSWSKETDFLKVARPRTLLNATHVEAQGKGARWTFTNPPEYEVSAEVQLPEGVGEPILKFIFLAKQSGQFTVGYSGAPALSPERAQWIWQPLVWTEKRFPTRTYLSKESMCSIPWTMYGVGNKAIGVGADSSEMPYRMPTGQNSRFGVALRNSAGQAQPMIFAPVLGGPDSQIAANKSYSFTVRFAVRQGDWYSTYRYLAQQLYKFRDIRENSLCSLNTTIENMIQYLMTDRFSNWMAKYKTWSYENDNGPGSGRQQSAADALSLALVCDDPDFYQFRALPTLEYLLSRSSYSMKISEPTYMGGCYDKPSDMVAAYNLTGRRNPVIRSLYESPASEGKEAASEVSKLAIIPLRKEMLNCLTQFRLTGNRQTLQRACEVADRYIELRINRPVEDFSEAGNSNFHDMTAAFDLLYELYEETGSKKYLEASTSALRYFTGFTYLVPEIPNGNYVANPGGLYNDQPAPEETVPAWRVSEQGLTAEAAGTAHSHRAIFMAPFASDMMRIAFDSQDSFLSTIARSAVVGRYANYPSYAYRNGYSTVYEKADYPLRSFAEIKKFTSVHYNHPLPMAMHLVDYLISETYNQSKGEIKFPSEYTNTVAYFRNKVYGAKSGKFYDESNVILWMPKGLLKADSVQVNYIAGRGNGKVYLALSNESNRPLKTEIVLNPEWIDAKGVRSCRIWQDNVKKSSVEMKEGRLTVEISPQGMTALAIEGVEAKPKLQAAFFDPVSSTLPPESFTKISTPFGEVNVTALRFGKGLTSAHVWLKADAKKVHKVDLIYQVKGESQRLNCAEYPFEFTVPLPDNLLSWECHLEVEMVDGTRQTSPTISIRL